MLKGLVGADASKPARGEAAAETIAVTSACAYGTARDLPDGDKGLRRQLRLRVVRSGGEASDRDIRILMFAEHILQSLYGGREAR